MAIPGVSGARAGWDVAVLGRGADGLAATVDEVHLAGRRGLSAMVDVADAQAVEAAADRIEAELGPIESGHGNLSATSDETPTSHAPRSANATDRVGQQRDG